MRTRRRAAFGRNGQFAALLGALLEVVALTGCSASGGGAAADDTGAPSSISPPSTGDAPTTEALQASATVVASTIAAGSDPCSWLRPEVVQAARGLDSPPSGASSRTGPDTCAWTVDDRSVSVEVSEIASEQQWLGSHPGARRVKDFPIPAFLTGEESADLRIDVLVPQRTLALIGAIDAEHATTAVLIMLDG